MDIDITDSRFEELFYFKNFVDQQKVDGNWIKKTNTGDKFFAVFYQNVLEKKT